MDQPNEVIKQARALLEHDERINLHPSPIEISVCDGSLILKGEVENLTTKRCALQLLRNKSMIGIHRLVDQLMVKPAEHRDDGALRDALCQALLADSTFHNCTLLARVKTGAEQELEQGGFETWQQADREPSGLIKISIAAGTVSLEGKVPTPSHKHLIEAMSWWLRGCRNVANKLEVDPAREETDGELSDALRLILEKDRFVEADQIRIDIQNRVMTLYGFVATREEKERVEGNAWSLSSIAEVINQIEVRKLEV
ncbi:BON domain-containing protein [Nitrosococcus watsonii]|uniref:Transport-associated protein n=1 Tax=Nitrosococcus watsoni (strain C-113) TaxID=105559 RepID=D8K5T3_NITWC|nr:BON domain-containing protein [Nitrosococcus watsonii]ADJ28260.1 transport-associated protein [Nitrosococcus watsonii C-113]